jgi:hypothetical protein
MADTEPQAEINIGDRVYQHRDGPEGPRYVVRDLATAGNGERIAICQVVGVAEVEVHDDENGEMVRTLQPVRAVANGETFEIRASALAHAED